jgi:hypothetical protein
MNNEDEFGIENEIELLLARVEAEEEVANWCSQFLEEGGEQ